MSNSGDSKTQSGLVAPSLRLRALRCLCALHVRAAGPLPSRCDRGGSVQSSTVRIRPPRICGRDCLDRRPGPNEWTAPKTTENAQDHRARLCGGDRHIQRHSSLARHVLRRESGRANLVRNPLVALACYDADLIVADPEQGHRRASRVDDAKRCFDAVFHHVQHLGPRS